MSHYDYEVSKHIAAQDWPFYALIMAAMRQADTENLMKLKAVFPMVHHELQTRYNTPGGFLQEERQAEAREVGR
jgi:hypothetical protein